MNRRKTIYFVEGDCEKQLINALKKGPSLLKPGRVEVRNPVSRTFTKDLIRTLSPGTDLVLVFDTDINDTSVLSRNIEKLKRYNANYSVITIPQVANFEDEIVRSTDVKRPEDLTKSKSLKNFKTDFIRVSDCRALLENHGFDIDRLWIKEANNDFSVFKQMSDLIKN